MRHTLHAQHRMSQRGIPHRLVSFALRHGRIEGVPAGTERDGGGVGGGIVAGGHDAPWSGWAHACGTDPDR